MSLWERLSGFFGWIKVRARDEDGRYVADDKSTDKNEAYEYKRVSAEKKPKKRGRKKKVS